MIDDGLRFSSPIVAPERVEQAKEQAEPKWKVTVYNNETNTYDEVITILMIATGCSLDDAYIEAWEIDHYGQCIVHSADEPECIGVADVIATIGINVEATPDN